MNENNATNGADYPGKSETTKRSPRSRVGCVARRPPHNTSSRCSPSTSPPIKTSRYGNALASSHPEPQPAGKVVWGSIAYRASRALAIAVGLVLVVAGEASAQTITQWTARVYLAGAAAPLSPPAVLLAVNVACGQAKITGSNVNPTKFAFQDPSNPLLDCVWLDDGTGILASTPFGGNFETTLTATNSLGTSAESSPRTPFTHPGSLPGVPLAFRALR